MATSRFESYVDERVAELAAPRREKLKAAYDAEEAKVKARFDKYLTMVQQGIDALVRKVFAKAKADGCNIQVELEEIDYALSDFLAGKLRGAFGLEKKYVFEEHKSVWPEGTTIREAQDALEAYDALCRKEAKRITVYKMDLGMKPEKFEAMLAETAKLLV